MLQRFKTLGPTLTSQDLGREGTTPIGSPSFSFLTKYWYTCRCTPIELLGRLRHLVATLGFKKTLRLAIGSIRWEHSTTWQSFLIFTMIVESAIMWSGTHWQGSVCEQKGDEPTWLPLKVPEQCMPAMEGGGSAAEATEGAFGCGRRWECWSLIS